MNINLNFVIFTTESNNDNQYVLSKQSEDIEFLHKTLESCWLQDIDQKIIEYLKGYVYVSDFSLIPQLITLHSSSISPDTDTLNVVYGFVVPFTQSINDCYWIPVDYITPHKYSNLLLEVIQKLQ